MIHGEESWILINCMQTWQRVAVSSQLTLTDVAAWQEYLSNEPRRDWNIDNTVRREKFKVDRLKTDK